MCGVCRRGAPPMTVSHQIRHTVRFAVPPSAIYRAFMDSRQHRAFTGAPARIEPKVGGRFTAWGPHLSGITVELVKDKRIVQAWRGGNWPAGPSPTPPLPPRPAAGGPGPPSTPPRAPAEKEKGSNQRWKNHHRPP